MALISCFQSLTRVARNIIFVATQVLSRQTCVCHDKTRLLSQQKYACCDKTFVSTKNYVCHDKTFVATKLCLYATNICHDKSFVTTKIFLRDKHNFVATKLVSQHAYFCRDKRRVLSRQTRVSRDKLLSRQKLYLWQLPPMIVSNL